MRQERIEFGAVLDKGKGDAKVWLIVIPVVILVAAAVIWGGVTVSRAGTYQADLARANDRIAELQKSIDERDKLLVQARADEGLLKSAGQATGMFFAAAKDATESGIAIANPDQHAVRVYLYGLVTPPSGREYVLAARGAGGARKALSAVLPTELGTGFVLARELPEGTSSLELLLRDVGSQSLDGATARVTARYPRTAEERGILMQAEPAAPAAQARRGRR